MEPTHRVHCRWRTPPFHIDHSKRQVDFSPVVSIFSFTTWWVSTHTLLYRSSQRLGGNPPCHIDFHVFDVGGCHINLPIFYVVGCDFRIFDVVDRETERHWGWPSCPSPKTVCFIFYMYFSKTNYPPAPPATLTQQTGPREPHNGHQPQRDATTTTAHQLSRTNQYP